MERGSEGGRRGSVHCETVTHTQTGARISSETTHFPFSLFPPPQRTGRNNLYLYSCDKCYYYLVLPKEDEPREGGRECDVCEPMCGGYVLGKGSTALCVCVYHSLCVVDELSV